MALLNLPKHQYKQLAPDTVKHSYKPNTARLSHKPAIHQAITIYYNAHPKSQLNINFSNASNLSDDNDADIA